MDKFDFDKIKSDFPRVWGGGYIRLECGQGWIPLIGAFSSKINEALSTEEFAHTKVLQIKEHFGGLRFSVEILHASKRLRKRIQDLTLEAEVRSYETCEICGSTEKVSTGTPSSGACSTRKGWLRTACDNCRYG